MSKHAYYQQRHNQSGADDVDAAISGDDDHLAEIDRFLSRDFERHDRLTLNDAEIVIVGRLAAIFCTQAEIASVIGCSLSKLKTMFSRQPAAREVYEDGLERAKIGLRRKQYLLAGKNHPMAIFLGKNFLGQKDVQTVDQTITTRVEDMSNEQLLDIVNRGVPATKLN